MSIIVLENESLTLQISSLGAEIQSIKSSDSTEYLWQGNPEFWSRRSPILFPIVGKLNNDSFNFESKEYKMTQHGFARDHDFNITTQSKTSITFSLKHTEETLIQFPFKFQLNITYILERNKLHMVYEIKNIDDKIIYFSIGAHPGFNIPLCKNEQKNDYFIEILPKKERTILPVTKDVLIDISNSKKFEFDKIDITDSLFNKGVIIIETPGKNKIILSSRKSKKRISVSYENMPYLGIWSTYPNTANFVCIEPWSGIADIEGFKDNLSEKKGINSLNENEYFKRSLTWEFD